jgi:alpha-amylase
MKKKSLFLSKIFIIAFCILSAYCTTYAQIKVKKVVFQAFWWDYWNENYRFGWANYLTELAPRLKAAGFNAIWIPPAIKNSNPDYVGYMPFDNYDLGDKRQKGNGHPLNDRMRTRIGTKDDLLRMIAVMHANGIEVIHDVVLNHNGDAGGGVNTFGAPSPVGTAGAGGQDPATGSIGTASGFKNFRYVSYSTPALDEYQNDYWTRNGRWSKNFQNFYNCTSGCNDINSMFWGPDINYDGTAIGQSSNIPTSGSTVINGNLRNYFNPSQSFNYMQDNARDWLMWLKKQTGSDGWRWDAVKHFSLATQETSIWHSKYNSSLTTLQAGGQDMFCVGEWIGDQFAIDGYANNVASPTAPGGVTNEKHTGTFDFGLRGYNTSNNGGLFQLVRGNGSFNMQNLPGEQQGFRYFDYPGGLRVHRSVNFVNSHDTYRPVLSTNGNFAQPLGVNGTTGWNIGSELGGNGQHIDPREPRLFAAYAATFAMDGNPLVFFEDLFDIGTTGKRYNHLPTNSTDLPVRSDIVNLMQAHQRLAFKDGDYGVATASNSPFYETGSSGDHLVIERVGKAIIGITDAFNSVSNNTADQKVYCKVSDSWAVGTVLYDYSGAHGINTISIPADRRVYIQTAPVGHTITNANGHGYSIWAPAPPGVTVTSVNDLYNYLATYQPTRSTTTQQEWEMANDLGDSHCESLGQGGALPTNSTNQRVAGKIYVAAGLPITYYVKPEVNGTNITVSLWDLDGNMIHQISGNTSASSPLTGTYSTSFSGWVVVKVRNTNNTQAGQKCWINVTYTAPDVVDTRASTNAVKSRAAIWTGNKGTTNINDCGNWEEGIMPSSNLHLVVPANANPSPIFNTNISVKNCTIETGATIFLSGGNLSITGNLFGGGTTTGNNNLILNGSALQTINGNINLARLEISNNNNISLNAAINISETLLFTSGKIILGNNNLTMNGNASITGANTTNFIQTTNIATNTGALIRNVGNASVDFPVGNTFYSPVTLVNNGTSTQFNVRCFESVLQAGTNGSPVISSGKLKKSWEVVPSSTSGLNVTATFSWSTSDEDISFNRSSCAVARNLNNGNTLWYRAGTINSATGTNPYSQTSFPLSALTLFTVYSDLSMLPVNLLSFTGTQKNRDVLLKWNTGSEINNKGFNIEKSVDGVHFINIGFVKATANPLTTNSYEFTDQSVYNKIVYYRLQQVDLDGKINYSNILSFNFSEANTFIQIYPNLISNNAPLEIYKTSRLNSNSILNVRIINSLGNVIQKINGSFDLVKASCRNALNGQPSGLYIFELICNGEKQQIKLIKQ